MVKGLSYAHPTPHLAQPAVLGEFGNGSLCLKGPAFSEVLLESAGPGSHGGSGCRNPPWPEVRARARDRSEPLPPAWAPWSAPGCFLLSGTWLCRYHKRSGRSLQLAEEARESDYLCSHSLPCLGFPGCEVGLSRRLLPWVVQMRYRSIDRASSTP